MRVSARFAAILLDVLQKSARYLTEFIACLTEIGGARHMDLMEYNFKDRGKSLGKPVVFGVSMDKDKKEERVFIALHDEALKLLAGETPKPFFMETRPLGSLFENFEPAESGTWNARYDELYKYYTDDSVDGALTEEIAKQMGQWLCDKYKGDDPISKFAAINTWELYRSFNNPPRPKTTFLKGFLMSDYPRNPDEWKFHSKLLLRIFEEYTEIKPYQETLDESRARLNEYEAEELQDWEAKSLYPLGTMYSAVSIQIVVHYYLQTLKKWGYYYSKCKKCGSYASETSRSENKLCDTCRAENRKKTNAKLYKNNSSKPFYYIIKNAKEIWRYNRKELNKKSGDSEKLAKYDKEFDTFTYSVERWEQAAEAEMEKARDEAKKIAIEISTDKAKKHIEDKDKRISKKFERSLKEQTDKATALRKSLLEDL